MAIPVFQFSLDVSPERRDWEMVAGDTAYLTLTFRRRQTDYDAMAIDPSLTVEFRAGPTDRHLTGDCGRHWLRGKWTIQRSAKAPESGTATAMVLPIITAAEPLPQSCTARMYYEIRTAIGGMVQTMGRGLMIVQGAQWTSR